MHFFGRVAVLFAFLFVLVSSAPYREEDYVLGESDGDAFFGRKLYTPDLITGNLELKRIRPVRDLSQLSSNKGRLSRMLLRRPLRSPQFFGENQGFIGNFGSGLMSPPFFQNNHLGQQQLLGSLLYNNDVVSGLHSNRYI